MSVIGIDKTETGSAAWVFSGDTGTASGANTAGAWSSYCHSITNAETVCLWDAPGSVTAASEFYGQCRVRITPGGGTGTLFIRFRSPNNTVNVTISQSAGGFLQVVTGSTYVSTVPLAEGYWYYLQWRIKINDTTGIVEVKVDGTTAISQTNIDTRLDSGTNGDTCDRIGLVGANSFGARFDDWLIVNTSSPGITGYPDNLGIEALMPNAAGDTTGLSRDGSDSGSNYGQVDERPPNSDTDYVYDTVIDDLDLYNLPATQWTDVYAVAVAAYAKKSEPGAGAIAHVVKADTDASGTADTLYTGSDKPLSTDYRWHTTVYDQQPDATAWTAAKVNALQAGVKVR